MVSTTHDYLLNDPHYPSTCSWVTRPPALTPFSPTPPGLALRYPLFAEVCPRHSKLQGARSARDVEKPRVIATNSWIELTSVGPILTDSSEPGQKRGESDLRDVNWYAMVRVVFVYSSIDLTTCTTLSQYLA